MSYILDALNKSEKERTRKRTPGLSSLEEGETPAIGIRGFLAILLVVVILNSAGIYYYFGGKEGIIEVPATATEPPVVIEPQKEPADIIEPEKEPPGIVITTHIYAVENELRMVKINGISRKEGDIIGDNHRLLAITERGLILEYAGETYTLNVVDDWQIGQ
ncbi:MAG: GspB domain-containing protein [Gammaproteobacteria bacterium]|jgi:hypothetical protein|nr:GspB domain-containing protein [Gammaproteobacteria bacterium]MBT4492592.1 GspB domain-containing protein [Gammaproteobacteria bacterium]MBT7371629.1 GspB domain-containing protein [Gammaproteobacteria bacterium]